MTSPRVFISYAWESDEYRDWVLQLAKRLRQDGVDARLDRWHLEAGESIVAFMNREVRHAERVLVLCSPSYRQKVHQTEDGAGISGSGWEAGLLAGQAFVNRASGKCIPVLAQGAWQDAAPDFLIGTDYVDLSDSDQFEEEYRRLLEHITRQKAKAPLLGPPRVLEPEVPEALSGETTGHDRRAVKLTIALIVLVLICALFVLIFLPAAGDRPIVAVLDLDSSIEPEDWYLTAIAELVDAHLAAGGIIYTIDRQRLVELEWAHQLDPVSGSKYELLHSSLGVTKVVEGSLEARGGKLQISWRLTDAATGAQRDLSEVFSETREAYKKLARDAADGLRKELGFSVTDSAESKKASAMLPHDFEAARHYAKGLRDYRRFNTKEALESFERAIENEEDHPLILRALARALIELGYSDRAVAAIERARESAERSPWVELLPWKERLEIEAEDHHFHEEWEEEADVYARLQECFPENVDYGCDRAEAQMAAGHTAESLKLLETLRKSSRYAARNGWIDLTAAEARFVGGDADEALELARRAGEKGERASDPFLTMQAKLKETVFFTALGKSESARKSLDDARLYLFPLSATREFFDDCLITAFVYRQEQNLEKAVAKLETCRRILRDRDYAQGEALVAINLSGILNRLARMDEAGALIEASLTSSGLDEHTSAGLYANLGVAHHLRGRLGNAWDSYAIATALYRMAGDEYHRASTLVNLGELAFAGGFPQSAQVLYAEALEILEESDPPFAAYARFRKADAYLAQGEIEMAARLYDDQVLPTTDLPQREEALLGRAKTALRQHDYGTAKEKAEGALVFKIKNPELAVLAKIIQARALLAIKIQTQTLSATDQAKDLDELILEIRHLLEDHDQEWLRAALELKLLELKRQAAVNADPDGIETLFDDLTGAARSAAAAGFVLAVIEACRELRELNLPGSEPILEELCRLVEMGRSAWMSRMERAEVFFESTSVTLHSDEQYLRCCRVRYRPQPP